MQHSSTPVISGSKAMHGPGLTVETQRKLPLAHLATSLGSCCDAQVRRHAEVVAHPSSAPVRDKQSISCLRQQSYRALGSPRAAIVLIGRGRRAQQPRASEGTARRLTRRSIKRRSLARGSDFRLHQMRTSGDSLTVSFQRTTCGLTSGPPSRAFFWADRDRSKDMRLKFLGSGDAFGSGGRFNTCFLVDRGAASFLIDCGASVMIALRKVRR